uniref:Uncharacterized protein n=1 Tax=Siphoviridae sp. ctnPP24 TaxID=2825662 RepID=A0A8S5TZA4_9CAUD|nr:MAG TPA: hypothetical protein [Siphoviridae sp. ctnPP24]
MSSRTAPCCPILVGAGQKHPPPDWANLPGKGAYHEEKH